MMQVLLDTSAIISLTDRSHHLNREIESIATDEKNLCIIPSTVVVEVCQLLKLRFGAEYEIKFIKEIQKSSFIMESVEFPDFKRIIEILEKYQDLNAGFVDASIVAIAERLGTNKLVTLDKKHFSALIPSGFQFFDLLV